MTITAFHSLAIFTDVSIGAGYAYTVGISDFTPILMWDFILLYLFIYFFFFGEISSFSNLHVLYVTVLLNASTFYILAIFKGISDGAGHAYPVEKSDVTPGYSRAFLLY